jgi:hypothetical protein
MCCRDKKIRDSIYFLIFINVGAFTFVSLFWYYNTGIYSNCGVPFTVENYDTTPVYCKKPETFETSKECVLYILVGATGSTGNVRILINTWFAGDKNQNPTELMMKYYPLHSNISVCLKSNDNTDGILIGAQHFLEEVGAGQTWYIAEGFIAFALLVFNVVLLCKSLAAPSPIAPPEVGLVPAPPNPTAPAQSPRVPAAYTMSIVPLIATTV